MRTTPELLRSAVKKLGPERSQQALRAFSENPVFSYCGCALAHAYGLTASSFVEACKTPGTLAHDTERRFGSSLERYMAQQIGLTEGEFDAVSFAHCGWLKSEGGRGDADSKLLKSLLEAEAAKIAPKGVPAFAMRRTIDE